LAFGIVDEIPQLADAPWPTRRHDSRRTGCLCGDATPSIASASATTLVSSPACCATEGGGAQVSFTLSADAAVTADVMNIAGRRIGHIVQDRELQAGANTLLWDGRSTRGLAVPAGMYLIRLTARDAEGGQSRSIGSLRLTR
jgi:flagellar hook assembly protein FlgD